MANVKISALPTLSSVVDADIFPLVDSGVTKSVTALNLKNYMASAGATGATGVQEIGRVHV